MLGQKETEMPDVYNEIGNVVMSIQRRMDEANIEAKECDRLAEQLALQAKTLRAEAAAYKTALDELKRIEFPQ